MKRVAEEPIWDHQTRVRVHVRREPTHYPLALLARWECQSGMVWVRPVRVKVSSRQVSVLSNTIELKSASHSCF